MLNESFNLLIDIVVLFSAIFYISYRGYLISKRELVLRKYKRDTHTYKTLNKVLRIRRLGVAGAITLLILLKTIFDVRTIMRIHGDDAWGQISSILIFVVLLSAIVFSVVYYIFNKNGWITKVGDK